VGEHKNCYKKTANEAIGTKKIQKKERFKDLE
jgi:hypothetical protein